MTDRQTSRIATLEADNKRLRDEFKWQDGEREHGNE
jgi:hypothetical protein